MEVCPFTFTLTFSMLKGVVQFESLSIKYTPSDEVLLHRRGHYFLHGHRFYAHYMIHNTSIEMMEDVLPTMYKSMSIIRPGLRNFWLLIYGYPFKATSFGYCSA